MTAYLNLINTNPVNLVKEIVDGIKQGYYVNTSIEGYPYLNTYPCRITLHAGDKPAKRHEAEGIDSIVIASYDQLQWLLDIQDLVLQGMDIDVDSLHTNGFYQVQMVRVEQEPVQEEKPKKQSRKPKKEVE